MLFPKVQQTDISQQQQEQDQNQQKTIVHVEYDDNYERKDLILLSKTTIKQFINIARVEFLEDDTHNPKLFLLSYMNFWPQPRNQGHNYIFNYGMRLKDIGDGCQIYMNVHMVNLKEFQNHNEQLIVNNNLNGDEKQGFDIPTIQTKYPTYEADRISKLSTQLKVDD